MNIPALIGVDYSDDIDGKMGIVDGYKGRFLIDPSEEELEEYRKAQEQDREKQRLLQELKGKENVTLDGKKINLYANIGGVGDVASALQNDAGGIGLFPQRIFVSRVGDLSHRGGAVQRLSDSGGKHGRQEGHHPHSGHRRG